MIRRTPFTIVRAANQVGLLAGVVISLGLVYGQDQGAGPEEQDPGQGRSVARISVINGDVSVRRGDSSEIVAAAMNAPLIGEDRLMTADGSRAEIQFDSSNMVRLSPNSEVRLAEMNDRRYQVQIAHGTATFRVLRDLSAEVELSTPSVSIRPSDRGSYRVSVRDDGSSEITVRTGAVEVYTPRGSERIEAGQTMMAEGDASDPRYQIVSAIPYDAWDRWSDLRDRDLESSRSYQYVSRDINGAEDLDANGRWINTPEYGWSWSPYTQAGWAPYRNGRWVWEDYYGWTWVSDDSWGWAPYHYGRWFYGSSGWCWNPGGFGVRHYWSPALVAFFGFGGGGVGVGFGGGFGHVGWVPLAPYEAYHPWYGRNYYGGFRSGGFVSRVNVVNNTNLTNIYRNSRVVNGVSSVDSGSFGRGRFSAAPVDQNSLRQANLVRGQLPMVPSRESLHMSDRTAVVNPRFAGNDNNIRFASRSQVRPVDRVPFDQQRSAMNQSSQRGFGGFNSQGSSSMSNPNPSGNGRFSAGSSTSAGNSASMDSGRFGGSNRNMGSNGAPMAAGSNTPASNQQGGWRRFGDPGAAPSTGGNGRSTSVNNSYTGGGRPFNSSGQGTINSSREVQQAPDANRSGWRGFGQGSSAPPSGGYAQSQANSQQPRYSAPAQQGYDRRQYSAPQQYSRPQQYSAPQQQYSRPQYSAPQYSSPRNSDRPAPQSYPQYQQAPQQQHFHQDSGFGRSDSTRMGSSPSIVRERAPAPAPSYQNRGGGGGHSDSAPRGGSGGGSNPGNSGGRGR